MIKEQATHVVTQYAEPEDGVPVAECETTLKKTPKPKQIRIKTSKKELSMLAKAASEFAKKMLAPDREGNDKFPFGPFFNPVIEKAFDVDFFHILLPEEFGGMNQGLSALSVTLENICREDSSLGGILFTTAAAHELLLQAGAYEEIAHLTNTGKVDSFLIGMPVFNNPSEITPRIQAQRTGDRFTLTGFLEYLVLGGLSGHALVPAVIDGSSRYSYFLVDLTGQGVVKSDPVLSLGFRACPAVDVTFIKADAILIGEQGNGAAYFEKMAARMNVAVSAMALGVMKGSFKEAFEYTKKREQGGGKIIRWSAVKMLLANMMTAITNAELIVERACKAVDSLEPQWEARAKAASVHVSAMACDITTDGVQLLGGVGYMKDFGQEKRFRDARHIQNLLGMAPTKKLSLIESLI